MGILCLQTQQGLRRGADYSVRGKDSRKWRRTDSEQRGKGAQEHRNEGVIKQRRCCGSWTRGKKLWKPISGRAQWLSSFKTVDQVRFENVTRLHEHSVMRGLYVRHSENTLKGKRDRTSAIIIPSLNSVELKYHSGDSELEMWYYIHSQLNWSQKTCSKYRCEWTDDALEIRGLGPQWESGHSICSRLQLNSPIVPNF